MPRDRCGQTSAVREGLERLGLSVNGSISRLSGGDISAVWRADTAQGPVVVKRDDSARLRGEADGLRALRDAGTTLRIPEVLGQAEELLVMQYLEPRNGPGNAAALGEGLRALHGVKYAYHGWPSDNACGLTPQPNTPSADGRTFQRERRLLPLGRTCLDKGLLESQTFAMLEHVAGQLESWLPDAPASLVHGDLWSGNVLYTAQGPAIIDPAVYAHYPEVDLAMLTLFGSPGETFFEAYWNGNRPDDWPRRQTLFQLYPLLNHLLLFGGIYRSGVEHAIAALNDTH
ncbi:fructosamine kinase family protein [Halomonas sp. WWR20]